MTINIVSAAPLTPASVATGSSTAAGLGGNIGNADDTSAPSGLPAGFAALLLSQQLGNLKAAAAPLEQSTAGDDAPASKNTSGTEDANAIFAALGYLGNLQNDRLPQDKVASNEPATATSGDDKNTPLVSASLATTTAATKTSEGGPELGAMPTSVQGSTQPANFAVELSAAVEPETAKKSEAPQSPAVNAAQIPTNSAATNVRHDAPLAMQAHVRDKDWSSEFTQKIVWLANNDKQSAQLTLNPPQMGPIEISVNVDKGSATATFVSANAEVRDAIETALPRLREMFASAGISLGQTNVSSESFRQSGNSASAWSAPQTRSDNDILAPNSAVTLTSRASGALAGNGLVDLFA